MAIELQICNAKGTQMKLILIARRRLDGLIDSHWVEGFEAYQAQGSPENCPYTTDTEEFISWIEGWMDADRTHSHEVQ
jgi:ribosome modulation factor